MSTRLQVVMEEDELREIRRAAARERVTVSEWVRGALRAARAQRPGSTAARKREAIAAALEHAFPAGDIDSMLADIAAGALGPG